MVAKNLFGGTALDGEIITRAGHNGTWVVKGIGTDTLPIGYPPGSLKMPFVEGVHLFHERRL